jgi:hypothetical protein
MKLTTALVALGLVVTTAPAHAADAPVRDWILVTVDTSSPARSDQTVKAEVQPWLYDFDTCTYGKENIEEIMEKQFPKAHYIVFCAQVPGLSR